MSYYRPPAASGGIVWSGRLLGLGGMALGFATGAMAMAAGAPLASILTPVLLGGLGSMAVLRSAEKAAQVRHDTSQYHRDLLVAQQHGISEVHLPIRMLTKAGQVSWLTAHASQAVGVALMVAGSALMLFTGIPASLSSSLPGGLAALAEGALYLTGGIVAWKVGGIANEARDFAYTTEAAAERARINDEAVAQARTLSTVPSAPAPVIPPVAAPRPLTEAARSPMVHQDRLAEERARHGERVRV